MNKFLKIFTKNQSVLYKFLLYVSATILVIYLLPKGGQFKYNFQKGKPWQYESLNAPFNFTIKKSEEALLQEEEKIKNQAIPFYDLNDEVAFNSFEEFSLKFDKAFNDSLYATPKNVAKEIALNTINEIYSVGYLGNLEIVDEAQIIYLKNKDEVNEKVFFQLLNPERAKGLIEDKTKTIKDCTPILKKIILESLQPNVSYNEKLSKEAVEQAIRAINPNKGIMEAGTKIIAKGEVVEGDKYEILDSLRTQYQSKLWNKNNYYWLLLGYALLVSLVFIMLLLFLKKYRTEIYNNNTKVSFIFFNIVVMVFITTLVVEYNTAYIYIIPLCILPIILKSFFDARLGLFVHVLTILLLGFIVPNSFEFLFLQIIAGIVTILTVSELYKRANLFISVGQITFIYGLGYVAFILIQEGNLQSLAYINLFYFVLCGLVTLFAFPLVYMYERLFGLVSEVSLLELSNTNSTLLKELSNKAPGTFHHSLNVANLCEAAANEIGANSMLVRVGALYHDIGKINNPTNFTENQLNQVNTLNELSPKESAKIIVGHVIKGIEIGRKNKLPDRIIDFIRTHHGTNLVYYFYKKEEELSGVAQKKDFQYPGPKPFSRETAILMMADSVEAASKSLKNPTSTKIDTFVENIINEQIKNKQFVNANITFKEIETIKKVLKKKLNNMYHLRVEYPD